MRQSVVSMSVGQPKTATRIVKEWLEDDVVPDLGDEVAAAPVAAPAGDYEARIAALKSAGVSDEVIAAQLLGN